MASSRLEKIGNIYTRVSGLIRAGALKWEDRPLFYDIYTAFPPLKEHKYKEDPPNIKLRNIFYEEDKERASKDYSNMLAFDMNEKKPVRTDYVFKQHKAFESKPAKEESKLFDLKNLDFNKE
ncbi:unnamed protein product [Chironomus riparius]|uniref:Small ribosomal subunit protein mS23 conserved domain-containing protein n=1 Tax=Chironomus riparius TaxID=315576 RepID=A0A9N9RVL9_9DIPT|nr:unnamed protein product [Chironomus riparius]